MTEGSCISVLEEVIKLRNIGEIHYHKENKTNGVNRLNSVQKATNLKKIKSGNK